MYFPFCQKVFSIISRDVRYLHSMHSTAILNGIYFFVLFVVYLHSCNDSTLCVSHRGLSALSSRIMWHFISLSPATTFLPCYISFLSSLAFSCIPSQFSPLLSAAFQNALPSFLWTFHHMHARTHTRTRTHAPFHPVIHLVSVCVWGCYRWMNWNDGWSEWRCL